MDGCVLLTSTPSCVVSPRGDPSGCALGIARQGETTHSGVDVNNTHPSMINPLNSTHLKQPESILQNSCQVTAISVDISHSNLTIATVI